jgi:hypothetical protein
VYIFPTWPLWFGPNDCSSGTRAISLLPVINIALHFPNLLAISLRMHNDEVRSPTFHQVIRSEIAQTLSRITPTLSALPSFNLIMFNLHFWIQDWSQAYLVPDDAYFDSLFDVIRATTAQYARLGQLFICGVIEGSLLRPGQHAPLPEPYCQNSPSPDSGSLSARSQPRSLLAGRNCKN